MTAALLNFFHMGGYGFSVFSAYSSVIILLSAQWFIPWRRWRHYVKQQNDKG